MFQYVKNDALAALVVFFVALPLCLGIALASGASPFSGILAGAIGGIVVGYISKSGIGVSGPAAGLVVIVATAIQNLGFPAFLLAVTLAGVVQILLGLLRAGVIGYYFPASVIKGMLSAIGIMIFIRQIPEALGWHNFQLSQVNLSSLGNYITPGAILVAGVSLFILLFWEKILAPKHQVFKLIPAPLVAVIFGVFFQIFWGSNPQSFWHLGQQLLVSVPVPQSFQELLSQFHQPDFREIFSKEVWITALTIAMVASLESLLSAEASDKLDPLKRITPANRELIAQGVGNTLAGLLGAIPITQVIVRSSANVMSGGRTKLSAILHGFLLLLSVVAIPKILNLIPMAVLAAVLLVIGFKLANLASYRKIFQLGKSQFIPFITTVLAIVCTDLLTGILAGLTVGIIVILSHSYRNSHFMHYAPEQLPQKATMVLAQEVTFLNKGGISRELNQLQTGAELTIDVRETQYLDYDILEMLDDFLQSEKGKSLRISVQTQSGVTHQPQSFRKLFGYAELAAH